MGKTGKLLSLILAFNLTLSTLSTIRVSVSANDVPDMSISFIDCGQGDAVLITSETETMLVDAGKASNVESVVSYIDSLGITEIDYAVSSHPDEDHIGGMPTIYEEYQINKSVFSSFVASTAIYNKYMNAVESEPSSVYFVADDENSWEIGDATIDVISDGENYSNANDSSLVLKVSCGETSLLLTGDISETAENDLVASGENIDIDILKIAHHGSASSSSTSFLFETSPKLAVISVGANNSYGHPTQAALDRVFSVCNNVYRTDLNGTVVIDVINDVITCDDSVVTNPEISYCKARTVYVTASGSKYHASSLCSNMKNPIAKKLSEAKSLGYTACSKCVSDDFELGNVPHVITDWIVDKKATVNAAGKKHKECTECGEVLETVTIPQLICSIPTISKIANTSSGVNISWGKVTGADSYRVYRKESGGSYKTLADTASTSYTDKTTKSGTKYYYVVKAVNEAGNSEKSASKGILFLASPKLTAIANKSYGVRFEWSKVSGADSYIVYRKVSGGSYKYLGKTTKTAYADKTAKSGTKYYYVVKAVNEAGNSEKSASKGITFVGAPTIKTPTTAKSGITVKWGKVTGAEGYIVCRKTGSGSYEKLAKVKGGTKVSYLDKSAKKGKTYSYKVFAYKGSTKSAGSAAKTIKDKY